MNGTFTSGRFRFQVERSDSESDLARGLTEDLEDEEFDLRLTRTGKVPELDGAPVASWLLARLARLTGGRLGLAGVEHIDGGGYLVEFVAYRVHAEPEQQSSHVQPLLFDMEALGVHVEPERAVASFQFQADMEGAAVLGQRGPDYSAEELLKALAAAVLAAPTDLQSCELEVMDPEGAEGPEVYCHGPGKGSCNRYGWDGKQFLGKESSRDGDLAE